MQKHVFFLASALPFMLAVTLDQVSKGYARKALAGAPPSDLVGGLVRFEYVENTGGFLGYFLAIPEPARSILLTAGVGALLLIFSIILIRYKHITPDRLLASTLIIAGGTGNLIDRLLNNGGVIDFIAIQLGPFRTGIFNFADVCILGGGFYLGYVLARSLPASDR